MQRKMRRVKDDAILGGVCSGMAYAFGMPTWVLRIIWFAASAFYGFGVLPYLLFWLFMPAWSEKPADYDQVTGG
jgi:phage shock protein PspC (stress-responsive transcriptional regulator)